MRTLLAILTMSSALRAAPIDAQTSEPTRTEEVTYRSAVDSTLLTAVLTLPAGDGVHPGVVVLSVAGTQRLVERLASNGYAVLAPVRRGFVAVEPLLRATYADLAGDATAALGYLGSRSEVDERALAVLAQADDAPPAMVSSLASSDPVPLVLMAPPAFPGTETFRREQRSAAERFGAGAAELRALDEYVGRIAQIVLAEDAPYARQYRLESLRAGSTVQLPYNAAFPDDDRQMHFFASPLWHDRLAFEPETVLAGLRAPVMVMIGTDDPNTPLEAYLAAVRRGLSAAPTPDVMVCMLPGRTRHSFTEVAVGAIVDWLADRVGEADQRGASRPEPPAECLEEDPGR